MQNNFSTSVNIIRDCDKNFNYFPTPNGKKVVTQLVSDFKNGLRCFNVIGSYGTGKSSFLWAIEQSVTGKKRYFETSFLGSNSNYGFIKIIGSYASLKSKLADVLNIDANITDEELFADLYAKYHGLGEKEKSALFIFVDEFGKFLEYASQNNPEQEIYFFQQLAEFCNNPKYNIVLISTVHQNIDSYSYGLTNLQRQEWSKVKGRFREITFNEPVEQLLFFLSEHLSLSHKGKINTKDVETINNLNIDAKIFDFNAEYVREISQKIVPMEIISAGVLTLGLQRYGQNERSLFSFLESTDHTGLEKFNRTSNPFYNLACVYEYINFNFYSFITSKYNPDFAHWASIRFALENVERSFNVKIEEYSKVIKTIGLLNIFSGKGADLSDQFIQTYLQLACGVNESTYILDQLDKKHIIRYRNHSKRYILFDGTDLDIETALMEASSKMNASFDLIQKLKEYFTHEPILANHYAFAKGTPRYFDFKLSEQPYSQIPKGEIDGFINLIFNENLNEETLFSISSKQKEAIIYCYFNKSAAIKNYIIDIEKTKQVLSENSDDKVAAKELTSIIQHQEVLLNHFINENLFAGKDVTWIWKGEQIDINSKKEFTKFLSTICFKIYSDTPEFKNELVNKHKISTSIHTAKKNYFKTLIENWDKPDLGLDEDKFPPEKTIYLSLLKENKIDPKNINAFRHSDDFKTSTFKPLWEFCDHFLTSTKQVDRRISELVNILELRPLKLKKGFIDLWVPTYLFLKRDDFALYREGIGYIPQFSHENTELLSKYPEQFSIKAFDIDGIKLDIFNAYRMFLQQEIKEEITNDSFIETIKPFLVFYRTLNDYAKNTKRISSEALKIREAIAKSVDPEKTFYENFPAALQYNILELKEDKSKLEKYTIALQEAVRDIRTAYDQLIQRVESFIQDEIVYEPIEFDGYKTSLQQRFVFLKKYLLMNTQKTFVLRLDSKLDDKKAWLSSLAQALTGKALDKFTDEDELVFYDKFKNMIFELDSLTEISKKDIDDTKEDVLSLKIDSFNEQMEPKIIRISKAKEKDIEKLKTNITQYLSKDKAVNIAAITKLLKELIQ